MKLEDCKVGMEVKFIDENEHKMDPWCYPPVGTIGTIVKITSIDIYVKWPKGSTSGKDEWYCAASAVEEVNLPLTDGEIWDMLSAKMEKNGVRHDCFKTVSNADFPNLMALNRPLYSKETLIRAVALAYRVGYKRAEKGRPFKYGDTHKNTKKNNGHWERVDPYNLPPIGAKLRLVKANPEDSVFFTEQDIGKIYYRTAKGVAAYNPYKELWVKEEGGSLPICSSKVPERFEYWVED